MELNENEKKIIIGFFNSIIIVMLCFLFVFLGYVGLFPSLVIDGIPASDFLLITGILSIIAGVTGIITISALAFRDMYNLV